MLISQYVGRYNGRPDIVGTECDVSWNQACLKAALVFKETCDKWYYERCLRNTPRGENGEKRWRFIILMSSVKNSQSGSLPEARAACSWERPVSAACVPELFSPHTNFTLLALTRHCWWEYRVYLLWHGFHFAFNNRIQLFSRTVRSECDWDQISPFCSHVLREDDFEPKYPNPYFWIYVFVSNIIMTVSQEVKFL